MKPVKISYPDECDEIVTELKKGKVKKSILEAMFANKHGGYNVDVLARKGLITRSILTEDGHDMIYLEFSGKDMTFKQGQQKYPKKKGGEFL